MSTQQGGTAREITIYSTSWCPWCDRAKDLIAARGASYNDVDIEQWSDPREKLEALSGQRSVPQIFIGETHVGGFDDLAALDADGVLPGLFEAEGIPVRV